MKLKPQLCPNETETSMGVRHCRRQLRYPPLVGTALLLLVWYLH